MLRKAGGKGALEGVLARPTVLVPFSLNLYWATWRTIVLAAQTWVCRGRGAPWDVRPELTTAL